MVYGGGVCVCVYVGFGFGLNLFLVSISKRRSCTCCCNGLPFPCVGPPFFSFFFWLFFIHVLVSGLCMFFLFTRRNKFVVVERAIPDVAMSRLCKINHTCHSSHAHNVDRYKEGGCRGGLQQRWTVPPPYFFLQARVFFLCFCFPPLSRT